MREAKYMFTYKIMTHSISTIFFLNFRAYWHYSLPEQNFASTYVWCAKVDTLTYFSSAAIVFPFKTRQIFASAASVIWKEIFYISVSILALLFEHIIGAFFHAFETIFCCIFSTRKTQNNNQIHFQILHFQLKCH